MGELQGAELDSFMRSATTLLELPIRPEWQDAIRANLEVTLTFALSVAAFELPDEAEPAPVFRP